MVKKIFSIVLWIFLIIVFIALAVQGQIWVAVGLALLVAIIYVIRYLRLKLGEAKKQKDSRGDEPSVPSVDVSFKSPFDK